MSPHGNTGVRGSERSADRFERAEHVAAVLGVGLLLVLVPRPAFAYLDAGSASVIFQSVLAAVLGAGVIAKVYWHRLRALFGLAPASSEADGEADDETP